MASENRIDRRWLEWSGPTLVAAVLAIIYVIVAPPSLDLAAQLFRARLFSEQGFSLWNDQWYSGHYLLSYSVLFGPVGALVGVRVAGALGAVVTAALFTALARSAVGSRALAGTLVFGAFTAIDLFTGRLDFAFGLAPGVAAVLALDRGRWVVGCGCAVLAALCAPLAALFTAVVACGYAVGDRRVRVGGVAVALSALLAVGALAIAFPEGGHEPFGVGTLAPVLVVAVLGVVCAPRTWAVLRAALAIYAVVLAAACVIASPVGANAARLGTLLAAPVAMVVLWGRRPRLLAIVIVPLLYIGVQAAVRDVIQASGEPSTSAGYYRPLLNWLARQGGPPFRIEIPFTALHWEAYRVALRDPLARGWERQLDIRDNALFYRAGALTATSYLGWLHAQAVRFVAVPDTSLDSSARREVALIDGGLPYLRLMHRSAHWRVYAVRDAAPIVTGAARLVRYGTDSLTLRARAPGSALVRVHWSPYWALHGVAGCVRRAGDDTRVTLRRAGEARLVMRFSVARIRASSPRCS